MLVPFFAQMRLATSAVALMERLNRANCSERVFVCACMHEHVHLLLFAQMWLASSTQGAGGAG